MAIMRSMKWRELMHVADAVNTFALFVKVATLVVAFPVVFAVRTTHASLADAHKACASEMAASAHAHSSARDAPVTAADLNTSFVA